MNKPVEEEGEALGSSVRRETLNRGSPSQFTSQMEVPVARSGGRIWMEMPVSSRNRETKPPPSRPAGRFAWRRTAATAVSPPSGNWAVKYR
jgi:hypothetical protein